MLTYHCNLPLQFSSKLDPNESYKALKSGTTRDAQSSSSIVISYDSAKTSGSCLFMILPSHDTSSSVVHSISYNISLLSRLILMLASLFFNGILSHEQGPGVNLPFHVLCGGNLPNMTLKTTKFRVLLHYFLYYSTVCTMVF